MFDRIDANPVNARIQPDSDSIFQVLIGRRILLVQICQPEQRSINRMFPRIKFSPLIRNVIEYIVRVVAVTAYIRAVSVKNTVIRLDYAVIYRKRSMVRSKVDYNFYAFRMGGIDKFFKLCHRTEVLIRNKEISPPITMIRRAAV